MKRGNILKSSISRVPYRFSAKRFYILMFLRLIVKPLYFFRAYQTSLYLWAGEAKRHGENVWLKPIPAYLGFALFIAFFFMFKDASKRSKKRDEELHQNQTTAVTPLSVFNGIVNSHTYRGFTGALLTMVTVCFIIASVGTAFIENPYKQGSVVPFLLLLIYAFTVGTPALHKIIYYYLDPGFNEELKEQRRQLFLNSFELIEWLEESYMTKGHFESGTYMNQEHFNTVELIVRAKLLPKEIHLKYYADENYHNWKHGDAKGFIRSRGRTYY